MHALKFDFFPIIFVVHFMESGYMKAAEAAEYRRIPLVILLDELFSS
jgi:hypothetical protein